MGIAIVDTTCWFDSIGDRLTAEENIQLRVIVNKAAAGATIDITKMDERLKWASEASEDVFKTVDELNPEELKALGTTIEMVKQNTTEALEYTALAETLIKAVRDAIAQHPNISGINHVRAVRALVATILTSLADANQQPYYVKQLVEAMQECAQIARPLASMESISEVLQRATRGATN